MNRDAFRRLFSEGMIGLSLVGGAYFLGVEPLQRSVAENRLRQDIQFISTRDIDPARTRAEIESMERRVGSISSASGIASDELDVMGRLNRAAETLGVQIQNIEKRNLGPLQPLITAAPSDPAGAQPAPPAGVSAPRERRFGFSITASGSYSQIIAFFNVIQNDMGFTTIDSANISPAGDSAEPRVSITLNTSHWWFDAAPAHAALAAGAQAAASTEEKP